MTNAHEEKETLHIEFDIPAHAKRTATKLFDKTREELLAIENHICWCCGKNQSEIKTPLQVHHHPIERSFANMIDFRIVERDCKSGLWGERAKAFDWDTFWKDFITETVHIEPEEGESFEPYDVTYDVPKDPYLFVDDALVNGLVLCEECHIEKDSGIHMIPFPMLLARKYGRQGYRVTASEIISH